MDYDMLLDYIKAVLTNNWLCALMLATSDIRPGKSKHVQTFNSTFYAKMMEYINTKTLQFST